MAKFFISFLILGCFFLSASSHCPDYCYEPSPCDRMDVREAIFALWSLPSKLTPLSQDYKNAILAEVAYGRDSQLPYLMGMSLWAVDMYTGFAPKLPPSSVYQTLIKATIGKKKSSSSSSSSSSESREYSGLDLAVGDFGSLCNSAIEYTVQVGLRAAGCPYKKMKNIAPPTIIGSSFQKFVHQQSSNIPCGIRDAIIRLSESCNNVDRTIAAGAMSSMTESSIRMFYNLMENDNNLLKTVRLKACNIPIPLECCEQREHELRKRTAKLAFVTDGEVTDIILDTY